MKQPKYITYRGAKYETIPTLNEIRVDPIPPRCCAVIVGFSRGETWFEKAMFYNKPAASVVEEFPSGIQLDEDTYCGSYQEGYIYMISTRNYGVGLSVYKLLEQHSKGRIIADEVIGIIDTVIGPNWEF